MKQAAVRYYFDADILGLGKLIARLRPDATYPGNPGAVVNKRFRPPRAIRTTEIDDIEWIPLVAAEGMVAISRDSSIARHPSERAAVMQHGARLFVLNGRDAMTVWTQPEVLMCQWRAIEKLSAEPGPCIHQVTRLCAPGGSTP